MRKHLLVFGIVVATLLLAGCQSGAPVEEPSAAATLRLGDSIEVSLAELLNRPRSDLAELADECATRIGLQEQSHRSGKLHFSWVPDLHLPLVVPVLREARYSASAGFSLPPYAPENATDPQLALHLARFGDAEAARKLAAPQDAETLKQIDACRYERNYPVEWTRLVGLLLHAAQLRLAAGDLDGGTELVVLHQQLRSVLDAKAAQGALGASLLPRGRQTLKQAIAAWRENKYTGLADQAAGLLAAWGEAPVLSVAVQPGEPREALGRLWHSPNSAGRVLAAESALRALDLSALPFPQEGADAVVAGFDGADQVADLVVIYHPGLGDYFPHPADLARLLADRQVTAKEVAGTPGLRQQSYQLGDWTCKVTVVVHGAGVGAIVHLASEKATRPTPTIRRDFVAIHLDRSFEQIRLRLAPDQRADPITVNQAKALAEIQNPLPSLKLGQAMLRSEKDLLAGFTLSYPTDVNGPPPLPQLTLPLWMALGIPEFRGVTNEQGGSLALEWQDAQTRYTLDLPYEGGQPVQLEVADRQGPAQLAQRQARAADLDREERKARLDAGKPYSRVPRHLEQLSLGMRRDEVQQALPTGQGALKRETPDGMTVTFRGEPAGTGPYVVRQLFIRFAPAGRVVELRGRYVGDPGAQGSNRWMNTLLNELRKQAGAPQPAPAPWAAVWHDLRPQEPTPSLYLWRDDVTLMAYQRDAGGVELALRDCPPAHEGGIPLPLLEYLPRGPENCPLGASREDLLKKWGLANSPTTPDGAVVLRPRSPSPYDAILVYFEKDCVIRIVARHVPTAKKPTSPAEWGDALAEAWGRDLRNLGWPRRQEATAHNALQGLFWHDERTRVRLFWQENDQGAGHVFTEWKHLAD
jgi:hypothetical protein